MQSCLKCLQTLSYLGHANHHVLDVRAHSSQESVLLSQAAPHINLDGGGRELINGALDVLELPGELSIGAHHGDLATLALESNTLQGANNLGSQDGLHSDRISSMPVWWSVIGLNLV